MLKKLRIQDFLLMGEAEIEFAPGLNVLTGETGTGKSVLLRALGLLFGRRGDPDWIRRDAPCLRIEGVFDASPRALRLARSLKLTESGDALTIVREVRRDGPSRCWVNGTRVLVGTLRRLADELVEVHGQREEERFRRAESQRDLLDLFAGHGRLRQELRRAYRELAEADGKLAQHRARIQGIARDEDWLRYQVEEIERLAPESGEMERLQERVREVRAASRRGEAIALAEDLLISRRGAVLAALEELDHRLAGLRSEEETESWGSLRDEVRELAQRARALARRVRELRREAGGGREELTALEDRLRALGELERKHRRSLPEVLALAVEMRGRLQELAQGRETEAHLSADRERCHAAALRLADELRASRGKAAAELVEAVHRELGAIEMHNCRLRVQLLPLSTGAAETHRAFGPSGSERVLFEVETNPGEGFRPLGAIASGGEMARLALALRVVLGERGHALLAVFDEIDTGLGGAAARAVAARLTQVAAHQQVLLVTHLPLIAAAGGRHFAVEKRVRKGATAMGVRPLEGEERTGEIARMLAGDSRDPEARQHAAALLGRALPLPARRGSARS